MKPIFGATKVIKAFIAKKAALIFIRVEHFVLEDKKAKEAMAGSSTIAAMEMDKPRLELLPPTF